MYHGVGVTTPTCVPADVKALAWEACRTQVKGVGALPGAWAQYDPCVLTGLPECKSTVVARTVPPAYAQEPYDEPEGGGEEGPEDRSGAFTVGGILLLLVAAGGGYYLYRRSKRRAA